ncbi:hypothetical protein ABIE10_002713 [Citrobacter sp. 506]|uniref:hypothetical protein n=1 Tax=Citrobacter sp. 506 TaxID=3156447 RepID=UPI0018EA8D02
MVDFSEISTDKKKEKYFKDFQFLPYDKNCVALAITDALGYTEHYGDNGVFYFYYRVRELLSGNFKSLEYPNTVTRVLKFLNVDSIYHNREWSFVKTNILTKANGRFFAVNTLGHNFDDKGGAFHAFCILKADGKINILGNNSENYAEQISDGHKVSVWGPIQITPH